MNNSEVFNNFVKIAKENGISIDDSNKNSEQSKKYLEKNHRASSQDISSIEVLYGVKPDLPKENDYKKNIMEDAHPQSIVVSPSYDKLNGLVENNIERQNIILNILNKTPNGQNTQHKYAKRNLILSLVKVSNFLDNKNKDSLRILSDSCLQKASFKKLAFPFPLLGAIAGIFGALYLQQHMSFLNEGLETNYQKLIAELDDLLESSSSWGIGTDYTSGFISTVQDLKSKLNRFYQIYQKISPIITDLEKPRTSQELIELSKQPQTDLIIKTYEALQNYMLNLSPYLEKIKENFKSQSFKSRQIKDKGFLSSLVDKTQILHGNHGLIADDFDDVVRALDPFIKSISDFMNVLKQANSFKDKATEDLRAATEEGQKQFGEPSKLNTSTNEEDLGIGDLEKEISA